MGVTTGFVTVGNFGSEQRMDYTIIGNQVNLAARLQAATQPGEILIAHETWLLVRDDFNCVPQEPIVVKGFERPVLTYVVSGKNGVGDRGGSGRIEESRDGFSLALDPGTIKPGDREAIARKLREALSRVQ
jgi:hypothetical protein